MPFQDDFAACMANAGIQVDASSLPDAASLGPVIDYIAQWVSSLDGASQQGLDAATTDGNPSALALSDPSVGVVDPAYNGLLQAFDNATGFPLSLCLQWCQHCAQQAAASAGGQTQ